MINNYNICKSHDVMTWCAMTLCYRNFCVCRQYYSVNNLLFESVTQFYISIIPGIPFEFIIDLSLIESISMLTSNAVFLAKWKRIHAKKYYGLHKNGLGGIQNGWD